MTYEAFSVVVVPFPFTDRSRSKRRPALVLSTAGALSSKIGHTVLAMITSAQNSPWPLDVSIGDLQTSGLRAPSVVRMKIFTLDDKFILSKLGELSANDRARVGKAIKVVLSELLGAA